jgi:hypothetical protein
MPRYACVEQLSEEDCGAACVASVAQQYGVRLPLGRVRTLVGTGATGTTLLGLRRGAEAVGGSAAVWLALIRATLAMSATGRAQPSHAVPVPRPACAHARARAYAHSHACAQQRRQSAAAGGESESDDAPSVR